MQYSFCSRCILADLLVLAWSTGMGFAEEPKRIPIQDRLDIAKPPIDYLTEGGEGPIARFNRKVEKDGLKLEYSIKFGYLPAVLKELEIPLSSQLLRFNSMALHPGSIRRKTPRAFYFNDDVVVSWFPGADELEVSAQDSQRGTLYYTFGYKADATPPFRRRSVCFNCHASSGWKLDGIESPGHINRSGQNLEARNYAFHGVESQNLPLESRWGSWYVSGVPSSVRNQGVSLRDPIDVEPPGIASNEELPELERYLAPTSDAVAHMIFDHQLLGQNLLSRLSNEHLLNLRSKIENMTLRYLLLVDEAPLENPVPGNSDFAKTYQSRGPKDQAGRSLYDLNLKTRLFEHRISPLIHSQMVRNLSPDLRKSLFGRLNALLTGREQLKGYTIPDADRQATLAVLRGTIPDWPRE